MIYVIILAALGFAVPIIGSATLCMPKWYRKVVKPRLPRAPETPGWVKRIPTPNLDGSEWFVAPLRLFIVLILLPFVVIAMVVVKYWRSVMSLIERKCPYTAIAEADVHYSQQSQAERFAGTPTKAYGELWNFLVRGVA